MADESIVATDIQPRRKVARYGWRPDTPDKRDLLYSAPRRLAAAAPPSVDLREHMPPIYDQGELGSCTGNAFAGAFEYLLMKQGLDDYRPSRLFIYYGERALEGTVGVDAGAELRDGAKVLNQYGAPSEEVWPYAVPAFTRKPSKAAFKQANKRKVVQYSRISANLAQMKACLAEGYPVAIGFTVYSEFEGDEVARTGLLNMPGPNEKVEGGHAVLVVGYNDAHRSGDWLVRNSWGEDWGDKGYFYMPYAYLLDSNLADDFWRISLIAA